MINERMQQLAGVPINETIRGASGSADIRAAKNGDPNFLKFAKLISKAKYDVKIWYDPGSEAIIIADKGDRKIRIEAYDEGDPYYRVEISDGKKTLDYEAARVDGVLRAIKRYTK